MFICKICFCLLSFVYFLRTEASLEQADLSREVVIANASLRYVEIDTSNLQNFEIKFPGCLGLVSRLGISSTQFVIATFKPQNVNQNYGYITLKRRSYSYEDQIHPKYQEIGRLYLFENKENKSYGMEHVF